MIAMGESHGQDLAEEVVYGLVSHLAIDIRQSDGFIEQLLIQNELLGTDMVPPTSMTYFNLR